MTPLELKNKDDKTDIDFWPFVQQLIEHISTHKLKSITRNQAMNIIDPDFETQCIEGCFADSLFCALRTFGVINCNGYKGVKSDHKRGRTKYEKEFSSTCDEQFDVVLDCHFIANAVYRGLTARDSIKSLEKQLSDLFEATTVKVNETYKPDEQPEQIQESKQLISPWR